MEQPMSIVTLGVSFQNAGMALALYPRHELAKDANVAADGQGLAGISLAYNTRNREEVDSVVSEAGAADAAVLKPARQAFRGGYSGYFPDPDEFLWEVACNPCFAIAEDGSMQLPDSPTDRGAQRQDRSTPARGLVPILGKRQARFEQTEAWRRARQVRGRHGHDPERRTGYGAIHFYCHLNWIEKVAVTVDDEC